MTATNYSDRIAAAAKALRYASTEEFQKDFNDRIGITEENGGVAALDDDEILKFGDFREAFKANPIATLRIAFRALKGGRGEKSEVTGNGTGDERTELLKALGVKTKTEDLPTETLLKHYLPDRPADPITVALKKRFSDKAVIAFRTDGAVAVNETMQYLADLEQSFPERETIEVDGRLERLWPVGKKPDTQVEEDPLFPGQPLRAGYSIVNNRNWKDIPLPRRQLCRIIVERGEIDVDNKEAVLRLLERAATEDGLQKAYPEADLAFRERQKHDNLPKLKVVLGTSGTKSNNPFGQPRKY
jgi:hypothetical protein